MLTDRQRVELVLFAQIMLAVTISGVQDKNDQKYKDTVNLLVQASHEPVADLPEHDRHKIMRRVQRVHKQSVMLYLKQEQSAYKIGLVAFFALQAITDCEYLILATGSSMDQAMDKIIEALQPEPGEDALIKSAQKQSRKFLTGLQREGYYGGVTIPD